MEKEKKGSRVGAQLSGLSPIYWCLLFIISEGAPPKAGRGTFFSRKCTSPQSFPRSPRTSAGAGMLTQLHRCQAAWRAALVSRALESTGTLREL